MKVRRRSERLSGVAVYAVCHKRRLRAHTSTTASQTNRQAEEKKPARKKICPSEELILSGPGGRFILGRGSRRARRRVLLTGEQRHPCKTSF